MNHPKAKETQTNGNAKSRENLAVYCTDGLDSNSIFLIDINHLRKFISMEKKSSSSLCENTFAVSGGLKGQYERIK